MGQGLLITLVAKARDRGEDTPGAEEYIERTIRASTTVHGGRLHFLKRGGRISAATASVGSLLHIKPICMWTGRGASSHGQGPRTKGLPSGLPAADYGAVAEIENQTVMFSHGDCAEEAQTLAGHDPGKDLSGGDRYKPDRPVIGAHAGPGTLAAVRPRGSPLKIKLIKKIPPDRMRHPDRVAYLLRISPVLRYAQSRRKRPILRSVISAAAGCPGVRLEVMRRVSSHAAFRG
jgi:hypothetical protein